MTALTLAAVTFTVAGDPIPQGSLKLVRGRKLVADNPRLAAWRNAVVLRAREAWHAHAGRHSPLYGPVRLDLQFAVRQRASAPKTWRDRTDWCWPTSRGAGDVDKLTRAVLDALTTAQVYRDDSQVVQLVVSQFYASAHGCPLAAPGAQITIKEVSV